MSVEPGLGILIGASDLLQEGGKGLRFPVIVSGAPGTGFVVRYQGQVHGYLNRCAHVPIELDWTEGEFFDSSGWYLMCATHGALYEPGSGLCAGGPCKGKRLHLIAIEEKDGQLFWQPGEYVKSV
jgi:nitrite reductase/ring-hydroxylating ferredoxin subunit